MLERGHGVRDRLLASPTFRRWAARFPLTRFIARRRTRALFDLCAGFVYSQILLACVRLRVADILYEGPKTLKTLSERLSLPLDATARLLKAAVALRLVSQWGPERFALGPLGAALVNNPAVTSMIEHHELLYGDLRDPVALLRGSVQQTALGKYWAYARTHKSAELSDTEIAPYTALMSASQSLIAAEVLDAYPLRGHRCLLDVGGGDGAFLLAAATQAPHLRLILFDLPAVAARARARIIQGGIADRATAVGGSFLINSLPTGADVASLIRVIHDHDDANALAILRAVRQALPPAGTLLLGEPMAGTAGAEPIGDAYFAFYLMALGQGRPRTPECLFELLRQAGFSRSRLVATSTPLLTRLIVARP